MHKKSYSQDGANVRRPWHSWRARSSMRGSRENPAQTALDAGLARGFTYVAAAAGLIGILVGAEHLVAWLTGRLSDTGRTVITMKTNAALCLTLVGAALLLVQAQATAARRWTARVCAALAVLVGLLTLLENLSSWNFGIDQLLATETPGAMAVASPNRMGIPASLSFTLTGLALLILTRRDRRAVTVAQSLALAVCLIALLSTIGFLYGAQEFYGIARYTGIAWPTAVSLLLVGLGLLCARPTEGLMAQVTANDPGGISIRRLLPPLVLLPLLLGWLRLAGEQAGIFDAATGTGIMMLIFIVIFSALAYFAGHRAGQSAQVLRESEAKYRNLFTNMAEEVHFWKLVRDEQGRIKTWQVVDANPPALKTWGRESVEDVIGKTADEVQPGTTAQFMPIVERIMAEGVPCSHEGYFPAPIDKYFRFTSVPLGEYFITTGADITAVKKAQEALRESEERFRVAQELSPDGFTIFHPVRDVRGKVVDFAWIYENAAIARMNGTDPQEVVGRRLLDVFPGHHGSPFFDIYRRVAESREQGVLEAPYEGDSIPTRTWFRVAVVSMGEDIAVLSQDITERKLAQEQQERLLRELEIRAGELQEANDRLAVVNEDLAATNEELRATTEELQGEIMDRKQAEEALRESEERFRSVLENMSEGLMLFDARGNLIYQNPASLRIHGFGAQEDGRIEHEDLPATWEAWDEKGRPITFEEWPVSRVFRHERFQDQVLHVRRVETGQEFFGSYNGSPICDAEGKLKLGFITIREITAQVRAQIELAARERRLRLFFESDMVGTIFWNIDGQITEANDKFLQMVGYSREDLLSGRMDWAQMTPPGYQDKDEYAAHELRTTGVDTPYEKEYLRKDGTRIPIIIGAAMLDERRYEGVAFVLDITDRKQTEEALRRSEAKWNAAIEHFGEGAIIATEAEEVIYWNPAARSMHGFTSETEGIGPLRETPNTFQLWTPDGSHLLTLDEWPMKRIKRGETVRNVELRLRRPDQDWEKIVSYSGAMVEMAGGERLIFLSVHDLTEQRKAEAAMRQLNATLENKVAERTAELAYRARQLQHLTQELTQAEERERRRIAVILHEDLQQQIAGAKFQLSLVRSRSRDNAMLAQIERVDGMLAGAVEQSRNLSHDLSPAVVHMNDLAEVLRWLVRRVRDQHGLAVNLRVSGDMILHSEAMSMFLFRAVQEMLFNVIKHAHVREAAIRIRRIGRYVCLSVSDRGRGFDLQEQKQTPGIGLFSIRERTQLLGGRMKIKSAKGRGSTLRILVPDGPTVKGTEEMVREVADIYAESAVAAPRPGDGVLRVLLVDDHEIVREGLAALLQEAPDIKVIGEAADGREALDMTSDLRPDVVVMDVSMPLMSGDQATRLIKMHLPHTRVIALSMFDEADKRERMYEAGAERYVLKTASADELLAAVRGRTADA